MRPVHLHHQPEHGLQLEDTLAAGDHAGVRHLGRYWLDWERMGNLAANPRISQVAWDLGCGSGYGSRILAQRANWRVLAVDKDPRALNAALRDHGHRGNLTFLQADLEATWDHPLLGPSPSAAPGLVVCHGLLEQLIHREVFLERLLEVISPTGFAVFSIAHPAQAAFDRGATPPDPRFRCRYDDRTLRRVLQRYFGHVVPLRTAQTSLGRAVDAAVASVLPPPERYHIGDGVYQCSRPIRLADPVDLDDLDDLDDLTDRTDRDDPADLTNRDDLTGRDDPSDPADPSDPSDSSGLADPPGFPGPSAVRPLTD